MSLRVLIAGNWRAEIHEQALFNGMLESGCSVQAFKWSSYFSPTGGLLSKVLRRIEYKLTSGLSVLRVNHDLVSVVNEEDFDLLFLYRPNIISSRTIKKIKREHPELVVAAYNNDDPFSYKYSWYVWRKFIRSIPYYDIVFSYRPANIQSYYDHKAKKVHLLLPWFDPKLSYPIILNEQEKIKYKADIVFIGHYENDGRIDIVRRLVNEGVDIALYGPGWNQYIKNDPVLNKFYPVSYLKGEEYNKALTGAGMALVIYSQINNDVYTRRCFEIPAVRAMMVAKRTKEMLELYEENVEAVYFSNEQEMVEKVVMYINNPIARERIALNGYNRACNSGYDVANRARVVIDQVKGRV